MNTLSGNIEGRYHICYYRLLDYVVPMATQASLCLIGDFEDGVINNIYNLSEENKMASLHIAILPLEESSVVLLFVENGVKKYRKFIKQLNKLSPEDQLSAINYMVFSYTENAFLRPSIYDDVKKDSHFMEVCRRTTVVETPMPLVEVLNFAIDEFSFSKRNTIPNLLSKKYAIKDTEKLLEY
jgi:hypothetical protein